MVIHIKLAYVQLKPIETFNQLHWSFEQCNLSYRKHDKLLLMVTVITITSSTLNVITAKIATVAAFHCFNFAHLFS